MRVLRCSRNIEDRKEGKLFEEEKLGFVSRSNGIGYRTPYENSINRQKHFRLDPSDSWKAISTRVYSFLKLIQQDREELKESSFTRFCKIRSLKRYTIINDASIRALNRIKKNAILVYTCIYSEFTISILLTRHRNSVLVIDVAITNATTSSRESSYL